MNVGDRVIYKSSRSWVKRSPSWGVEGKRTLGTVIKVDNNRDEITVYWDSERGLHGTSLYGTSSKELVQIKPLMIPVGTNVYLKDYSMFEGCTNEVGQVILRSSRLGIKVNIGRKSSYVSISNIVICNSLTEDICYLCGRNLTPYSKDALLIKGRWIHSKCAGICVYCGSKHKMLMENEYVQVYNNLCKECKGDYYIPCSLCGTVHFRTMMFKLPQGKHVCGECMKKDKIVICSNCGYNEIKEKAEKIEKKYLCGECKKYIFFCAECGKRKWQGFAYGEKKWCTACGDNLFTSCSRCASFVPKEVISNITIGGEEYKNICSSCRERLEETLFIHKWNYRPSRFTYSKMKYEKDTLYLGMELEVELGSISSLTGAKATLQKIEELGISNYFYLKQDGSLARGHSFELVSQPATLAYIRNNYKIYELLKFMDRQGYDCTKSGKCGLHVHISNKDLRFKDVAKIKMFLWKHREVFKIFGNKDPSTEQQYARFEKYRIAEYKVHLMLDYRRTKYTACNLTKNTLEFRFWRGTFEHLRFLSVLSFSEAIVYYIKDSSLAKIHYGRFEEFILWLQKSQYFHLVKYFNLIKLAEKEKEISKEEVISKDISRDDAQVEVAWDDISPRECVIN